MQSDTTYILTVNAGSSSIKFSVCDANSLQKVLTGKIDRIGMSGTYLSMTEINADESTRTSIAGSEAITSLVEILNERFPSEALAGIGHRIVHGGVTYTQPTAITGDVLTKLETLSLLAPQHLPGQIALIRALTSHFPLVPQYACFDTSFHHTMPKVAKTLPLPRKYHTQGVQRYGFHGLSYEFLMHELQETLKIPIDTKKIVLAHLGNGSSLTGVRNGQSIETSMGFTPTSGVPMGMRSGDLDPGLFQYFSTTYGFTPEQFDHMVNFESGILGVSGSTADMEVLLKKSSEDPSAREAVNLYCYHVKKYIGSLTAVLGGIDILVFAGGIGEGSAHIRKHICTGLEFLGIEVADEANVANRRCISSDASRVIIYTIPTDEEFIIAQHMHRLMQS